MTARIVCVLLLLSGLARADLVGLSDSSMAETSGQDGIALQIDFHLNTGNDGKPLSTLGVSGGAGCVSPMQSGSVTLASAPNPCHMAIQALRPNNPDLWLVYKDMYGFLNIPNLLLDEVNNPTTATAYANPAVFKNASGTCLISTGCGSTLAQGLPTTEMHFQSASGTGTFSDNINIFLNIGRVSMEFGATGYNNDNNGSFMGLRVSDLSGSNAPARINLDGQVRVYGF